MRLRAVLVSLALLAGAAGCGDSKKGDNSNIQTPNDQPIGGPQQSLGSGGGEKPAQLGTVKPGKGGPPKPLPTVELK
jgi:hypothetical protein